MSQTSRPVTQVVTPEPVVEGAGVHLRRSLGTRSLDHLDPFPAARSLRVGQGRRLRSGLPLSPAPRHRDGDARPPRPDRPRRFAGAPRDDRGRRHPVDELGQRHPARGDAAGAPRRHRRTAALAQPAGARQDGPPAVSRAERRSAGRDRDRHRRAHPHGRRRERRRTPRRPRRGTGRRAEVHGRHPARRRRRSGSRCRSATPCSRTSIRARSASGPGRRARARPRW